jgi:hypothetical protein
MCQRGLTVAEVHPESIEELHDAIRYPQVFGRRRGRARVSESCGFWNDREKKIRSIPLIPEAHALAEFKTDDCRRRHGMYDDLLKRSVREPWSAYHQRYLEYPWRRLSSESDVIFIWGKRNTVVDDILKNPQWRHSRSQTDRSSRRLVVTLSPRAAAAALILAAQVYPEDSARQPSKKSWMFFYRRVSAIHTAACCIDTMMKQI